LDLLKPDAWQLACPVCRGERDRNISALPIKLYYGWQVHYGAELSELPLPLTGTETITNMVSPCIVVVECPNYLYPSRGRKPSKLESLIPLTRQESELPLPLTGTETIAFGGTFTPGYLSELPLPLTGTET